MDRRWYFRVTVLLNVLHRRSPVGNVRLCYKTVAVFVHSHSCIMWDSKKSVLVKSMTNSSPAGGRYLKWPYVKVLAEHSVLCLINAESLWSFLWVRQPQELQVRCTPVLKTFPATTLDLRHINWINAVPSWLAYQAVTQTNRTRWCTLLIQFDLLMISIVMPETCREIK